MKTCSKCKRDLPESMFVKSDRYLDGFYPSCKDCRKATRQKTISRQVLCFRCEASPRMKSTMYCSPCLREITSEGNKNKPCEMCRERVRGKCSDFCSICASEIKREYENGKSKEYRSNPENRDKILARAMLNYHVRCGNIEKLPCSVCGNPKTEGHHHKGYDRAHWLDVIWLCIRHHIEAERLLKVDKIK